MSSQCQLNRSYICCKKKKERKHIYYLLNPLWTFDEDPQKCSVLSHFLNLMANVFFLRSLYHIFLVCFIVSSPLSFRVCLVWLLPGFLSAYPVHFHYLLYIFSSECTRLAFFQQVMAVDLVWPVNLLDFLGKLLMKFCVLQMVTFVILQDSELGLLLKYSSVSDVLEPLKENSCFYISVCPSLLVGDTADQCWEGYF